MRRLFLLLMFVLVAAVAVGAVGLSRLNQSPFDKTPSELHACGRTYVLPAPQSTTRAVVEQQGLSKQDDVWTWQGKKDVWGKKDANSCGSTVFLKVGGNEFFSYTLSGSP
jgi:hypothetical protein